MSSDLPVVHLVVTSTQCCTKLTGLNIRGLLVQQMSDFLYQRGMDNLQDQLTPFLSELA